MVFDPWPDFEYVISNPPYSMGICVILRAIKQWLNGQNVVLVIPAQSWANISNDAVWKDYPNIAYHMKTDGVAFQNWQTKLKQTIKIVGFL